MIDERRFARTAKGCEDDDVCVWIRPCVVEHLHFGFAPEKIVGEHAGQTADRNIVWAKWNERLSGWRSRPLEQFPNLFGNGFEVGINLILASGGNWPLRGWSQIYFLEPINSFPIAGFDRNRNYSQSFRISAFQQKRNFFF